MHFKKNLSEKKSKKKTTNENIILLLIFGGKNVSEQSRKGFLVRKRAYPKTHMQIATLYATFMCQYVPVGVSP